MRLNMDDAGNIAAAAMAMIIVYTCGAIAARLYRETRFTEKSVMAVCVIRCDRARLFV